MREQECTILSALVGLAFVTSCVNSQSKENFWQIRYNNIMWFFITPGHTDGDARLVNGNVPSEGRVEVYYNGGWGTVCDDFWGLDDAHVVCKQLGFPNALQALQRASHGQGRGRIVLDDLHCEGIEPNLLHCPSLTPHGHHSCQHSEDASVICLRSISKWMYMP